MSSSDRGRGDSPGARTEPVTSKTPTTPDASDPYTNWLDRMQRARVRHAAITKNLYTWSNYKNWADRMRDSFESPPGQPAQSSQPGHGPAGTPPKFHKK